MQGINQEQYIHKRLLYKFDKKIQLVCQEYFKHKAESTEVTLNKQQLLEEINLLSFQNFKYHMAFLSTQKDQIVNQKMQQNEDQSIEQTKVQIKQLTEQLHKCQKQKRNKLSYNELCSVIMRYEKKTVMDSNIQKIQEQIKELQQKYDQQMKIFHDKERCLKSVLITLKGLINATHENCPKGDNNIPTYLGNGIATQPAEYDGQIY